jgi:hypothetical protein
LHFYSGDFSDFPVFLRKPLVCHSPSTDILYFHFPRGQSFCPLYAGSRHDLEQGRGGPEHFSFWMALGNHRVIFGGSSGYDSNSRSAMLCPSRNVMENFREFSSALNQLQLKNLKNLGYSTTQELKHSPLPRMY